LAVEGEGEKRRPGSVEGSLLRPGGALLALVLLQVGEGGGLARLRRGDDEVGVDGFRLLPVLLLGLFLFVRRIDVPGEAVERAGAVAGEGADFLSGVEAPDLDLLVVATAGEAATLGGEGGGED